MKHPESAGLKVPVAKLELQLAIIALVKAVRIIVEELNEHEHGGYRLDGAHEFLNVAVEHNTHI